MIQEPDIHVGIMADTVIAVTFNGDYLCNGDTCTGAQRFFLTDESITWNGNHYGTLLFTPRDERNNSFTLHDVTIGIGFHWQQREPQQFRGALQLIIEGSRIRVINHVKAEEYLRSVISSEMRATSSAALLKAHAIISRSWLLAQIAKRAALEADTTPYRSLHETSGEIIRWYDREEHDRYDVCADDHCQRYQGITRATTAAVDAAIDETYGTVLYYNDKIADARFSKCCGGVTELFENCWEDVPHPYLAAVGDNPEGSITDLRNEEAATRHILSQPDAFCNTHDRAVLSQVLNDYDLSTTHFYRWKVSYRQEELTELVGRRSGIDFGTILDLQPIERGPSGRIVRLRIVGSRRSVVVGKELEIRRWLSESHLYSSAFVVEKCESDNGILFTLHGAGWGHGVGLCQIGAAVMSEQGYRHDEILAHYYPGTILTQLYTPRK